MTKLAPLAVPTSTIIARRSKQEPHLVCVLEQTVKHSGRITLVGGRVELPRQNFRRCAFTEWRQEAGGKGARLRNLYLWAVKTDPNVDIRQVTLGKIGHNLCAKDHRGIAVSAHYGVPDAYFVGDVIGTPFPRDGEGKRCFFYDIRKLRITETADESEFGAQHDLALAVYREVLEGRPFNPDDFSDFTKLRRRLLSAQ